MVKTVALTLFCCTASAALVIAAHSSVQSQAYSYEPVQKHYTSQCFKQVAPLAKRLGVKPSSEPGIVAAGCDGKQYDVLQLVNAFLDHIDRKAK